MKARVEGTLERNDRGRLRVGHVRVVLQPTIGGAALDRLGRCNELFEDFCVVTQSVREGITVDVAVEPTGVAAGV
jgi:hypothetical protein